MTRDDGGAVASARWRMFVALPVATGAASAIHAALAPLRDWYPTARWIEPDRYHVTLRFLGSAEPAAVPGITSALDGCARASEPVTIGVGRGGGARGRSEVAWLGISPGVQAVTTLADELDARLPAELRASLRPGRPAPHLTVARRAPRSLADVLGGDAWSAIPVTWIADRIVLFRSHTGTPGGSRYEPIAEARLGERAVA